MFFKKKQNNTINNNFSNEFSDDKISVIFKSNDEFFKVLQNIILHKTILDLSCSEDLLDIPVENSLLLYNNMDAIVNSKLRFSIHEFMIACQCILLCEVEGKSIKDDGFINSFNFITQKYFALFGDKDIVAPSFNSVLSNHSLILEIYNENLKLLDWCRQEHLLKSSFEKIMNDVAFNVIHKESKSYLCNLFLNSYFTYYLFAIEDVYIIGSEKYQTIKGYSKAVLESNRKKLTLNSVINNNGILPSYIGEDDLVESVMSTLFNLESNFIKIMEFVINKVLENLKEKNLSSTDIYYIMNIFCSYYVSLLSRVYFDFVYDEDYWKVLNSCVEYYLNTLCLKLDNIDMNSIIEKDVTVFFMLCRINKKNSDKKIDFFMEESIESLLLNISKYFAIENSEFNKNIESIIKDSSAIFIKNNKRYLKDKLKYDV